MVNLFFIPKIIKFNLSTKIYAKTHVCETMSPAAIKSKKIHVFCIFSTKVKSQGHKVIDLKLESFEMASLVEYACQL